MAQYPANNTARSGVKLLQYLLLDHDSESPFQNDTAASFAIYFRSQLRPNFIL